MPISPNDLGATVKAMRPVVPARDFELAKRFYVDLGFQPEELTDGLIEMRLGAFSFLLQDYYVQQWADNFVVHLLVTDVRRWWDHIVALDLAGRYGVKTTAPRHESWGLVAGVIDPSGVLWRIVERVPSAGR
jgi:glyoxalase/bleomycin resistance protein/dioxygenase superfamily protein